MNLFNILCIFLKHFTIIIVYLSIFFFARTSEIRYMVHLKAVRLLDIRNAHEQHINVAQLHTLISQKLAMSKSEGDSGVKSG